MKKLIVFNLVTLDGYFAGVDGDIDWHMVDDEFNDFAVEHTQEFGTFIFGRTTYKIFEDFWPELARTGKIPGTDQKASPEDILIGKTIDEAEKIVFSKTLKKVNWKRTRLFDEVNPEEILAMKEEKGKPMAIFGSGTIVQELTNLQLIDEYRLLVNPIILAHGKPMFANIRDMHKLKLQSSRQFKNGNVLLTYTTA